MKQSELADYAAVVQTPFGQVMLIVHNKKRATLVATNDDLVINNIAYNGHVLLIRSKDDWVIERCIMRLMCDAWDGNAQAAPAAVIRLIHTVILDTIKTYLQDHPELILYGEQAAISEEINLTEDEINHLHDQIEKLSVHRAELLSCLAAVNAQLADTDSPD